MEKRSFEESLPGALKPGNPQKKSGEKEREPQGCLAGLFLVNVMENAKSLSFASSFPVADWCYAAGVELQIFPV